MKVPPLLIAGVSCLAIALIFGGPNGIWVILLVGVVGMAITYLPRLLLLAAMELDSLSPDFPASNEDQAWDAWWNGMSFRQRLAFDLALWMLRASMGVRWFCTGKRLDMEKFLREEGLEDDANN